MSLMESTSKICIHCCSPFSPWIEGNHENHFITPDFPSSSPTERWLVQAVLSIFKLNCLNCFDNCKRDRVQQEDLWMCQNCNELFTNLHSLYNDFLEVGKINSYLSKKLRRLDDLIDGQQQQQQTTKSNLTTNVPKTTTTASSMPELRILLTRLPRTYLRSSALPINIKEEPDDDDDHHLHYDSSASLLLDDYEDVEPLPELPKREENDVAVLDGHDDDDDVNHHEPPLQDSDSSEGYIPALKKTKITKKRVVKASNASSRKERKQSTKRVTSPRQYKRKETRKSTVKKEPKKYVKKVKDPNRTKGNKRVNSKNILYNYLSKKEKFPNPCWYCDRTDFPTSADLVEHTRSVHLPENSNPLGHVCQRCSRICSNNALLTVHLKKCDLIPVGTILPKTWQCPQCEKCFAYERKLSMHMLTHTSDRPFACDECPFRARAKCIVRAHKIFVHGGGEGDRVACEECGKIFKNEIVLRNHKRNKHTAEGYEVYRHSQDVALARKKERRLMARAAGGPVTVCADCNNLDFFSSLAYKNHRRTFHGDHLGSHTCHICGHGFNEATILKAHIKQSHLDDRSFLCNQCGKAYKNRKNLQNHEKQAHSEEGRLKYNKMMREYTRKKKIIAAQMACVQQGVQMSTTTAAATDFVLPGVSTVWNQRP